MKIRLLSVGRDKGPTAELADEYAARIRRVADLEVLELRAQGPDREADALIDKTRGELWALDERGQLLTSAQLSQRLGKLRDAAQALTLCVGGDEGLSERVRGAARFVWSLSPLTLPHRLARVVALEQVYRAFEILRGGPYHKWQQTTPVLKRELGGERSEWASFGATNARIDADVLIAVANIDRETVVIMDVLIPSNAA